MTDLFHWTCDDHGEPGITLHQEIRPCPHPWLSRPLVWVTDLSVSHPLALGLTSSTLYCRGGKVRFQVHPTAVDRCTPWTAYARTGPVPRSVRAALEDAPGALPEHWWVSERPLPILTRQPVAH